MPSKLDFSKLSFQINWATGSVIVTLLVGVITLYLTNKSLEGKVSALQDSNATLIETVNALKGSQEVTNRAIDIFLQNPTSELKYRIDVIEKTLRERFNLSVQQDTTHAPFQNKMPGQ